MDHQLPVSTIYISAALAVAQEETPQWMSGVIIIRNPFYSLTAQIPMVEPTVRPSEVYEVWITYVGGGGSVGYMRQLFYSWREYEMQQDDVCVVVAFVNSGALTTAELAVASTGQTPVDPLSK